MNGSHDNGRRAPPAFQTYASDRLADRNFKAMPVAEHASAQRAAA